VTNQETAERAREYIARQRFQVIGTPRGYHVKDARALPGRTIKAVGGKMTASEAFAVATALNALYAATGARP